MKTFFGSFFGTLVAFAFLVGMSLLVIFALIVIAAQTSPKGPTLPKSALLVLDLSVPINDAPKEFDPSEFFSDLPASLQEQAPTLQETVQAIRLAANDSRIKGIYLTGTLFQLGGLGSGYPALKEIREALIKFKESSKPIYAFIEFGFTSSYYLQSVADQIFVDPQAELVLRGPASSPLFFAGALKKFGIGVQVSRVGKYKSYVEPYIRENMSPENREQLEKLFGDLWGDVKSTIEQSRGLPPGSLEKLINDNGLINGDLAVKSKLGTELVSQSEIIERFKKQYGVDKKYNTFNQITVPNYLDGRRGNRSSTPITGSRVAIVYAEGDIVGGEGKPGQVGGDKFARELRKLREDPDVKAIVLRVNSPGGSVWASEQIYREIKATVPIKPVIASFGAYAASGGYYIAAAATRIFAQPTTITGSIGIFGLQVNFEKIANDNGVTTDSVTTTKPLASLFSPFKQKTDEDMAIIQKMLDKSYEEFLEHVSDGRKISVNQVNEIAQGRVWSGVEAGKIKLVDETGGLRSAVLYAAKLAQLGEHPRVSEFPAKKRFPEQLQELFKAAPRPPVAKVDPLSQGLQELQNELKELQSLNDPEGLYARLPLQIQF
jgi:protease IV